jgi:hypothetical protein
MFSQSDLLRGGWTEHQIALCLDGADAHAPSTHWLSSRGESLYDAERVAVAAHCLGISGFPKATKEVIEKWRHSYSPTRLPILTMYFSRIAEACTLGAEGEFRSLRMSHPRLGRIPGSAQKEETLIRNTISTLLTRCDQQKITTWSQAEASLTSRAADEELRLGPPWPNVFVRNMSLTSRCSRAASPKALARVLDALSLLHAGKLRVCFEYKGDLPRRLSLSPALRFDPID